MIEASLDRTRKCLPAAEAALSTLAQTLLMVEPDDQRALALRKALQSARIDALLVRSHGAADALRLLRGSEHHDPLHAGAVVLLGLLADDAHPFLAALAQDSRLARAVVFAVGHPGSTGPLMRAEAAQVLGAIDPESPTEGCRQLRELLDHYALASGATEA